MLIERNDNMQQQKRSLILAGGGMRLAYQTGVLLALDESGISFNHVDATSGGIFNAGMLASGHKPHQIAQRWRQLDIKHFMSARPLKNYFKPLNMMGYADADGIRDKIFPGLGIDVERINRFATGDVTFNVCNFSDKSIESIPHNKVQEDYLIAGVSLPIVMPAIEINGQWYSDAVWIKDANLMEAVKRGANELWLVWAIGNTATYLTGALNQYVHMIEMSANGGLLQEYAMIEMVNAQILQGQSGYGQKKPLTLFVIKPEFPLPLDPDLFFRKIDARSLINMGYADTKTCMKSMPPEGVAMDAGATKMKDPGIRLNIRNQFHGILSDKQQQHKVSLFTYMVLSSRNNKERLNIYSSIHIDAFGLEIPCFDHQIETSKINGKRKMEFSSRFIHRADEYILKASWQPNFAIDLLLGLAFKSVQVSIKKMDGDEDAMEGRLHQNIKQRRASCVSNNIRKQDGKAGGIGIKYRMALKLMNYEI